MLETIKTVAVALKSDKRGVTALEYGLIAGVLAVGLVAGFGVLSTKLSAAFNAMTF